MMMGDGADPPNLRMMSPAEVKNLLFGKNILFAVHGFNVNQCEAVSSFAAFDARLGLGDAGIVVGVLWPGDAWIPVVNYPFEGNDARNSGNNLADYCNTELGGALSLSFVSHSLGVRVVLQAVAQLEAEGASRLPHRRRHQLRLSRHRIRRRPPPTPAPSVCLPRGRIGS